MEGEGPAREWHQVDVGGAGPFRLQCVVNYKVLSTHNCSCTSTSITISGIDHNKVSTCSTIFWELVNWCNMLRFLITGKFNYIWADLSIATRVSSSNEALKPSWLDNELIKGWLNWLQPIHLASTCTWHHSWWILPGLPCFPLFCFCVLLSMQTEERKRGRAGNEANIL